MDQSKALMFRLENEYKMLMGVPENEIIHIEPAPGETPPCVSRYLVTYHVPTWVKDDTGEIHIQNKTVVEFAKTSLCDPAKIKVVEGRPPFHADWYEHGMHGGFCYGRLMTLYDYMKEILYSLQFREETISIHSPSNHAARDFYLQHRADEPSLFPTDTREMPALTALPTRIRIVRS